MGKLELLFKKENVEYVELENELTKKWNVHEPCRLWGNWWE